MKHGYIRFIQFMSMLTVSIAAITVDAQDVATKITKAQQAIIHVEDAKFDAFLKTFVLTNHARTIKDPVIETCQHGPLCYTTFTHYDVKDRTATLEIQFKDGNIHTLTKPVLLLDYRLLLPEFIEVLHKGIAKFIKQNKLHDGRSVYFLTSPARETFKLTIVYPWHNQEVTHAAQQARSQRDWKAFEMLLIEHEPVIYFTGTKPVTPVYRISNLAPLLRKTVTELRKETAKVSARSK